MGNDAAPGSAAQPLRTAQKLVESLVPGETGCLKAGRYAEDVTFRRGGVPGQPIRLASAPGTRATVRGKMEIADSANDVVVAGLLIDTRNTGFHPSPAVLGDRVSFIGNEITNYNEGTICLHLGSVRGYGVAVDTIIEGNRIHACGRLPANNHEHGIYVENARNARIVNNLIYDNATHGVVFFPNAENSVVAHNVLDGNGQAVNFSGEGGVASDNNRVIGNIISNSILRYNVESWYPAGNRVGVGNVVEHNCLWNGRLGNLNTQVGFVAHDNVFADPGFVDRAGEDFRLKPDSPCARMGP